MATQAIAGVNDKVLAATLPGIMKGVGMQVYNQNAFWSNIYGAGRKREWEGDSIQAAVMTSKYNKAASYVNDDTVDTTSVEPFTAVQWEMGGYQVSVNIPKMKIRKVTSGTRLFELVRSETEAAMLDMVDLMSTHAFQAANDAKGINSLSTITDASTTLAGLAGSSTWGGTTTASGSFATQGKNDLMTLKTTLSVYQGTLSRDSSKKGLTGGPNLCVTTRANYQRYWNSLESSMRYTPGGVGDVNLKLTFDMTPIIVDEHVVAGVWYMLNTDSLALYVHPEADFTLLPETRSTAQPDVFSRAAIWNGQWVLNSRRPNGKLTGVTD